MFSVNAFAMAIVRRILEAPEALGVTVGRLANGSTLIDMGQAAPGSWEAGRLFTLVTVGGLGQVSFESFDLRGRRLPAVRLMTSHPLVACMACQVAGWRLTEEPDSPILAGPARALRNPPDEHVLLSGYRDVHPEGVITVQMSRPVSAEMAAAIAGACGLRAGDLYILATRHACLVSAIQVAARGIETAMHRLALAGFDLRCIRFGWTVAPIAPLVDDELVAMGRINDALYYGSEVGLTVAADDDLLAALAPQVVTAASSLAQRPFAQVYREAGFDFHKIPREVHTPAILHLTNLATGRTFSAGQADEEVLVRSFYG